MDAHAAKPRIEERSTTRATAMYTQASGSGMPLTANAEGEEIVYSHMKV